MEVKKIVEGMTAVEVAEVIDSNFKNQNKILEEDIATQNSVIGVSEYKDFSEAEAVSVGDVRKYNGFLYECVEATTGAFDASKWKKSSFKAETEKKLTELGSEARNNSNLVGSEVLSAIGEFKADFPSSLPLAYSYYRIPLLKKGGIYKFTIILTEEVNATVYWGIYANRTENVVNPPVIESGEIYKEVIAGAVKDDYEYFEVRVYSSVVVPKFRLRIENHNSEMNDVKNDIESINTKIKENANFVNGELLHSIGNIEMDFPSSSLVDYVFYELPLLKKGETYKLTMTLNEEASTSIYWVIVANHTEEIFSPPYFQEGDISKEWSVNINNDYDSFEIRIYSGKTVPEWKLLIESSSSDIQELKDNVDAVYKNNESMKESLEKVYTKIGAIPTIEFTKQAINGTTGEPYNTSNRIASSFINGEIIQVNITEGKYGVFAYTDNEYISETGWKNAGAMYNVPGATRYRIVLAKTDDSAISPSDIDYFGVNIDTSANASVLITREQYLDNSKKEIVRKNIGAVSSADISSLESAINNSYSGKFNVTRGYDNKQYSDIIRIFKNQVYTVKCTVNEVAGQALYVQLFDAETGTAIKQLMSFVDNDNTSKEITYKTDVEQLVYIGFYSSYSGIREVSLTLSSEINLKSLYAKSAEEKVISSSASALYNPFRRKMLYHHLNQETAGASTGYKHTQVPAQSLYDVAYAKALGFEMIEANVHACSDGVFITKHGSSGTFGEGLKSDDGVDYKNVAINTISSDYIRQHITYDSSLAKYNSPIPTLDEFASECKKHGMLIKADYKEGALEVLRQYLTDDCIFFTGMKKRGNFKGMMEIVWNGQDFSTFKSSCEALGHPLNIVVAAGTFSSYTDEKIKELTSFAHSNGYTTSVAYATTNDWVRAKKLGIDANISTFRSINDFELGIDCNINDLTSNDLILDGCTYNDIEKVINMPKDSIVYVKSSKIFGFGKCAVDVCYNGTITVIMGQDYSDYNLDNFKSDGRETINVANVIQDVGEQYNRWVTIKANENTVIKNINIRASYIPV